MDNDRKDVNLKLSMLYTFLFWPVKKNLIISYKYFLKSLMRNKGGNSQSGVIRS